VSASSSAEALQVPQNGPAHCIDPADPRLTVVLTALAAARIASVDVSARLIDSLSISRGA